MMSLTIIIYVHPVNTNGLDVDVTDVVRLERKDTTGINVFVKTVVQPPTIGLKEDVANVEFLLLIGLKFRQEPLPWVAQKVKSEEIVKVSIKGNYVLLE